MHLLRTIIGLLVVLGLALPTARASVFSKTTPAAMEDCEGMKAAGDEDCPCCHESSKCPPATCAIKCLKTLADQTAARLRSKPAGQIVQVTQETLHHGLELQPPARPPRI